MDRHVPRPVHLWYHGGHMAKADAKPFDHHRGSAPLLRPTSRWRSGTFLAANLLMFVAVNAFWWYLSSGRWTDFSQAAFRRDIAHPLLDVQFLLAPVSIFTHPWMILVTGLLLSLVIFTPVMVSVLYRLVLAGGFLVAVAVIGHAPVLAAFLALGCVLAARTPLRSDMPFVAFLLGLAPVGLYLVYCAHTGIDAAAVRPLQRWLLALPFLIAGVSAVVAAVVVLILAQATGFRPGVVWPMLALLLAAPLLVFYTEIGVDELSYGLLVHRPVSSVLDEPVLPAGSLAATDATFPPVDRERWVRAHGLAGLEEPELRRAAEAMLRCRQAELIGACEAFLHRHARGARAAEVAWLRAHVASLQLDAPAFTRGLVHYAAHRPLPGAGPAWEALVREYPTSAQAALGRLRLAELALTALADPDAPLDADSRGELLRRADEDLLQAVKDLQDVLVSHRAGRAYTRTGEFADAAGALPSRHVYADALRRAERIVWLIEQNNVLDDPLAAEALGGLLRVDPLAGTRREQVSDLLTQRMGRYERTKMEDNLRLAYALSDPDLQSRVEALSVLAGELNDAAIEANYELGRLLARRPELELLDGVQDARTYFRRVRAAPPSPYTPLAEQWLRWLPTAPAASRP